MAASVPEALKKKRVLYQAALAKRALAQQNAKKAGVLKRRAIIKRAAAYAKEYAQAERNLVARKRQAKANGNAYVPAEPKLAFVIRIRGINQVFFRIIQLFQPFFQLLKPHPGLTPRQEDPPASPSPPDRQRHLCQVEQGHQHDAQHCSGIRDLVFDDSFWDCSTDPDRVKLSRLSARPDKK